MVLSYRTGAAGAPASAARMAGYYASEADVPRLASVLAGYLGQHFGPEIAGQTAAVPARDMHPMIAAALGIDPTRSLTEGEMARLLSGRRADGLPIPGKEVQRSVEGKAQIAYTDFTFSAPKSFSVALAFAQTDAERAVLEGCFLQANNALVRHIAEQIGGARQGRAGRDGVVPGHMAVVHYDHYTSRSTVQIPVVENGVEDTEIVAIPENVAGEMNRHRHNIFLHATATEDGQIKSPNLDEIRERVHTWGAIGHAYLSTYLQEHGVKIDLDPGNQLSRLVDVDPAICKMFSSRGNQGEDLARRHAAGLGLDWDSMDPDAKRGMVKAKVAATRQSKTDGRADYDAWMKRAADVGYQHRTVLRPGRERFLPEVGDQIEQAYHVGLPLLSAEFVRRSVLDGATVRTIAARSLIVSGIREPGDVDLVTQAYRTEGIKQDGVVTPIAWGGVEGKRYASITTELHVAQEQEAIGLMQAAGADLSGSLTLAEIGGALDRVAAAKGYDFSNAHGLKQRAMAEALATGGRFVLGIGAAGVGKTTLIEPVIDAYHARGWQSYGVTLAWRQTHDLKEAGVRKRDKSQLKMQPDTDRLTRAGIAEGHALALTPFLKAASEGKLALDAKTLVVLDEVGTIGTRQILELARLQQAHGFKLVGIGDPEQCQAIEAGSSINLFRRAVGADQVPEILETIRQRRQRDRDTAMMFRAGNASGALANKDAAGLLRLVPGGYTDSIRAGVDEWERRIAANADRPKYSIGLTVPTNADALAVGEEIRRRIRAAGGLTGKEWAVDAIDQNRTPFEIRLAAGDRVRLFHRINAKFADGGRGYFGENGTVADVVSVDADGVRLRRADGRVGAVRWATLQDADTGRVRLSYGHALTIDARQGATLTDHITILPGGTQAVTAFKMYPADTRNREDSVLIVSHGAEKDEVRARRPLGDPWLASASDTDMRCAILENMARNLARKPEKTLAVDFLARARDLHWGSVQAGQAIWNRPAPSAGRAVVVVAGVGSAPRPAPDAPAPAAPPGGDARELVPDAPEVEGQGLPPRLPGMTAAQRIQAAREAKRSVRPAAQRPKKAARKEKEVDRVEAQAEFAGALRAAGLVVKGPPIMDGRWHRAGIDGKAASNKSGRYRGFLDGRPAGWITNYTNGYDQKWNASGPAPVVTADMRRALEERQNQRSADQLAGQTRAGKRSFAMWSRAQPAKVAEDGYLARKGVGAHGLRLDAKGNLLVPMRDASGFLHNVQTIKPDGAKLFVEGGRMHGLFATLGELRGDRPIVIGEGFATAATLRETSSLPVVVAFNSGNLLSVAQAIRAKFPDAPIIIAGDNDHHLPQRDKPLPNVGKEKAEAAAAAVGGVVLLPTFREGEAGTDWNDWKATHGADALRVVIEARLEKEGIKMAVKDQAPMQTTQAQRDAARSAVRQVAQDRGREQAQEAARRASQQAAQQKQRDNQKGA